MREAKRIHRVVLIKSDFREYLLVEGGMRILDMGWLLWVDDLVVLVLWLVRVSLEGRSRRDWMLGDSVSAWCSLSLSS